PPASPATPPRSLHDALPICSTRMVGVAREVAVKEADEYEEFNGSNPGNSAPGVVWLASDASIPVTGQVVRVLGNSLAVYKPWERSEEHTSELQSRFELVCRL